MPRKMFPLRLDDKERKQLEDLSADMEIPAAAVLRTCLRNEHRRLVRRQNSEEEEARGRAKTTKANRSSN